MTMESLVAESDALVDGVEPMSNAVEPGMGETVINRPSAEEPFPAMIKMDSSAGWMWVYRTDTGEPVSINQNMRVAQLAKRFPTHHATMAGKLAFTDRDPGFRPKAGMFKCMLHAESPEREQYTEMGLGVCKKSNLINRFQVTSHMEKTHKTELKAINQVRNDLIAEEERQVRRALINQNAPVAAPVQAEPVVEVGEIPAQNIVKPDYSDGQCPQCEWTSKAKKVAARRMGVKGHINTHNK